MADKTMPSNIRSVVQAASDSFARTIAGQMIAALDGDHKVAITNDQFVDLLALIRRIKRKAEVMRLDAARSTTARKDAEEIRILAEMAEKLLGGEHA